MDLTDYPGKIYSYHTMFTKANEFYIKIYGIDYNPTEQEKLKAGTYTINVTGDVEIEDVAISKSKRPLVVCMIQDSLMF